MERAERETPTLVAIEAIGEKAEIAEEDVDVLAIGGGGGGSGGVQLIERFGAAAGALAPPQDLAGIEAEAQGVEFAILDGGEENAIAAENGGGMAGRQRRFPNDAAFGPEGFGQAASFSDSGAVGAAEARPVTGRRARREGKNERCRPKGIDWEARLGALLR